MTGHKNSNLNITPRHIYIDCSGTFYTGFNTGIQRTVRNIVLRSKKMEEKYNNMSVIPVIAIFGRFMEVNLDDLYRRFYKEKKTLFDKLSKFYLSAEKKINNKDASDKNTKIKFKLIVFANIKTWLKSIFQTAFFGYLFFFKGFKFKTVKINSDDLIFLPDTYWSFNVLAISKRCKAKKGASIVPLVHDIIAVTHPQFFDSLRIDILINQINKMIDCSDGFICNSKYSADELRNYIAQKGRSDKKPIEYFYLGNDLDEKKEIGDLPVRNDIKAILKDKSAYLMVGTIEPRKNHLFVLDAFEKLWEDGFKSILIFVGAVGWNCDNILKRFKDSKFFNIYLFVYHDINDAELQYLYKNSKALIIASAIEGFGFPLVEAAQNNINVFASDIPVFREIGKGYPVYFSLDSKDDFADKIMSFELAGKISEKKEIEAGVEEHVKPKIVSLNWDDSIKNLCDKLINIYTEINLR